MGRITLAALAAVLVVDLPESAAQMTHRLKGTVRTEQGADIGGARIHAEAIIGFRGGQFVGQRDFDVTSNTKGEWSILGLSAGVWLFHASAPNTLPQAIVLTIDLVTRRPISATGDLLRWQLPFTLRSADGHTALRAAADAALQEDGGAVTQPIATFAESDDADQAVAAGELALIVKQPGLAAALFGRALTADERHPRGLVGAASAALMQGDWDRATKQYWQAREVAPRELRQAIAATITDLQQVTQTGPWR